MMKINIQGLQKLTLLDWLGRVACTVFLGGCNFRCPFCHNGDLVIGPFPDSICEGEFLAYLEKRRGLLDGVCITGGEPLLRPDLENFLTKIKELGFPVKLDTNGSDPVALQALWERGLIDYAAMDLKNSPARYAETVGLPGLDLGPIRERRLAFGGGMWTTNSEPLWSGSSTMQRISLPWRTGSPGQSGISFSPLWTGRRCCARASLPGGRGIWSGLRIWSGTRFHRCSCGAWNRGGAERGKKTASFLSVVTRYCVLEKISLHILTSRRQTCYSGGVLNFPGSPAKIIKIEKEMVEGNVMYQVTKRDGAAASFEISKISAAITKAFEAKGKQYHPSVIDMLSLRVTADFEPKIKDGFIAVEDIQDSVEKVLSEAGYADVAKAYILYRKQRRRSAT